MATKKNTVFFQKENASPGVVNDKIASLKKHVNSPLVQKTYCRGAVELKKHVSSPLVQKLPNGAVNNKKASLKKHVCTPSAMQPCKVKSAQLNNERLLALRESAQKARKSRAIFGFKKNRSPMKQVQDKMNDTSKRRFVADGQSASLKKPKLVDGSTPAKQAAKEESAEPKFRLCCASDDSKKAPSVAQMKIFYWMR